MPKRTRDHQAWLIEKLSDPARAASYLNAARKDSQEMFFEALRDVAQARQMSKVAKDAGVTRESLYKVTSVIGNPTYDTFDSVLEALGLDFEIKPRDIASVSAASPIPGATVVKAHANRHVRSTESAVHTHLDQVPLISSPRIAVVDGGNCVTYTVSTGVVLRSHPDVQQSGLATSKLFESAPNAAGGLSLSYDIGLNAEHADVPLSLVARAAMQQREQEGGLCQ